MRTIFPLPRLDELTPEQRAVVKSILERRPSLDGPFLPWLHRPALASAAERVGAYLRFDTRLSPMESELAILCVAMLTECKEERRIHLPFAERAGLSPSILAQLGSGVIPKLSDPRLALVASVCRELVVGFRLSDPTYEEVLLVFGPETMIELVALVGYYTLIAMTLNAVASPSPSP